MKMDDTVKERLILVNIIKSAPYIEGKFIVKLFRGNADIKSVSLSSFAKKY